MSDPGLGVRHRPSEYGLSLIELMTVIVILAILAAIIGPVLGHRRTQAEISALQSNLKVIQEQIIYHGQHISGHPPTIDPAWFKSGNLPRHPQNNASLPAVETVDSADVAHPADKVLKAGVSGAYWYNAAEGIVRARIRDQGSASQTIDFYNEVHGSQETSLGNYMSGP